MDGTTGVPRAKRKSKKDKTVDPPAEVPTGVPIEFPMMPKMEPIDLSLHSNPFLKSEPRNQSYSGMQEFATYYPHSMLDSSMQSYHYLPQDFGSRDFQYASRMPPGEQLATLGASFMDPYQSSELSTSHPYAMAAGPASFEMQNLGMQPPVTSFGPIISWEPWHSSHEKLQSVKVEEEQQIEGRTYDFGIQFSSLPAQPLAHSMEKAFEEIADHQVQYPIQSQVDTFDNSQVDPNPHHQALRTIEYQAKCPNKRPIRNTTSLHVDLPAELQDQHIVDDNFHQKQNVQGLEEYQTQITAQTPAGSPVVHSFEPNVDNIVEKLDQSPIQRSASITDQQPVDTSVRVPMQQAVQESIQPVQTVQPMHPVSLAQRVPSVQPLEPVQPVQPVQQPTQQATQAQQPIVRPEPIFAQQPALQPFQLLNQHPPLQPMQKTNEQLAQHTAQNVIDHRIDYPLQNTFPYSTQSFIGTSFDKPVHHSNDTLSQPCQPTEQAPNEQRGVIKIKTIQE
jgi:hypothetical protein